MSKYISIRVSTLRGDQPIGFDAYVKVAGKYILFCREGDSFEGQRLERLRAKKLQKMWILKEQEHAYRAYLRENIERAYQNTQGKPIDIRAQIIQGMLQANAEDLMEDLSNDGTYRIAIESAQQFRQFMATEPEALNALLKIKNTDHNVAHHGVTVSSLALGIAEESGLLEQRAMQINAMVVGCLIHDLEHTYNNLDLMTEPARMARNEFEIYLRHSELGAARLNEYPFYDKIVRDIVCYHEERIDGSGFLGKKERDLDPLVLVAATANSFDQYLKYGQHDPREALRRILIDKMGIYPLELMKALQDCLKRRGVI